MRARAAWPLLVFLGAGAAHADDMVALRPVTVHGASHDLVGVADAASEGVVTAAQLAHRPLLRPAEVLEAVPGMIVTQHSGDGKANQYFLRGFNLDHGSDFATHVMGAPVNMVSHAHGQGYMDLNFLIPELVGGVKYRKGMYAAADGDFVTAGSARIDYRRELDTPYAEFSAGARGYRRVLAAGSQARGDWQLLGALELAGNDGPWAQPEELAKTSAVLRLSQGSAANGFALTAQAYQARWRATEHVPLRAIESGEIGRYGFLSPHDGGTTHRLGLSAEWARADAAGAQQASAYFIDYGLNLFSGPSGFIRGAEGDQHEQADRRRVWGGEWRRVWQLGPRWSDTELSVGVQYRRDAIAAAGLYDTIDRLRIQTVRADRMRETASAAYVEARSQWTDWLRSNLGVRRDALAARVVPLDGAFNMGNGGTVAAARTHPKFGVAFGPFALLGPTEFYGNWGRGFHSNDARGATSSVNARDGGRIEPVPLLAAARGRETGVRATPLPGWNTSLALWRMDLASELVFVGDSGVTEPRGASRRHGLEWSNHYAPREWLMIDADLALSQARFKEPVAGGGTHVPNAIPLTAALGLVADPGGRWFAGLRLRYLGAYALEETASEKSTPFWMANLRLGYRPQARVELTLDILNLFDRKANDIEYWGGACTRTDGPACNAGAGIDGRLVHPLEPRTLRLAARIGF